MATSKRKTTKTRKNTNKSGEGALKRAKRIARGLQEPVRTTERRSKSLEEFEGTVSLSRDGFGFVKVEGLQDDVFVPMRKLHFALNGDFVKIAVSKRRMQAGMKGRSLEGEVVKIIRRSTKPHIGILVVRGRQVWAIVESKYMPYDIRIDVNGPDDLPEIGGLKAAHGMKVAVLVTDWPKRSVEPVGRIVDVLGVPGENDPEMHAILAEFQLPYRFEPEVEQAAEKISDAITPKDLAGPRDFRGVTTFTIDRADAKDFDDALSFRELENGHLEVGIHIADVTHYVTPGSPIDKEAFARGTSVYLVDRTIPMLPEKLSNNLCSLRPKEDKLTFSAVFEMNDKAKVIGQWFGRTVINSDYRFDYEQAQQIIETGEGPLAPEIARLHALASILRKERFAKGAISFERPEMKVIVDETGKPVDVVQKESKESNWLIEEFMLLANRCVAEYATKKCKAKNPTFVYRIHENPDPEKLDSLRNFANCMASHEKLLIAALNLDEMRIARYCRTVDPNFLKELNQKSVRAFVQSYRSRFKINYDIQINDYATNANLTDFAGEAGKLKNYIESKKAALLRTVKTWPSFLGFGAAALGIVGAVMLSPAMLVFTVGGAAFGAGYLLYGKSKRKSIIRDHDNEYQVSEGILNGIVNEFVAYRQEYAQYDSYAQKIAEEFDKI